MITLPVKLNRLGLQAVTSFVGFTNAETVTIGDVEFAVGELRFDNAVTQHNPYSGFQEGEFQFSEASGDEKLADFNELMALNLTCSQLSTPLISQSVSSSSVAQQQRKVPSETSRQSGENSASDGRASNNYVERKD